jgi:flagellar motor switch protein FliM
VATETLSQQQIDALFKGGAPRPSTDEPPAGASTDVRVYDFHRPNLISKDRLRALEAKYGLLCKALESWLTARLRGAIELRLLGVEQFSFGEFTLSLPNPTSSFVFNVAESAGQQVVVDFGRSFSFFLVNRLLGSNEGADVPDRSLTVLERLVVRIAADQVAAQLNEIWKSHVDLALAFNRFESVPELLRTANKEDPVLVANIEVRANHLEGTLLLCVPFGVIEKFLTASGSQRVSVGRGTPRDREADRTAIEGSVRRVTVEVSVRTPGFSIGLGDLARLVPGATLGTGLPSNAALTVRVEGTPRFIGQPGRSGRSLAVRITDMSEPVENGREDTRRRTGMATVTNDKESEMNLTELGGSGDAAGSPLGSLFQVTLPITIELGRTRMSVQEVLELGRGSVITLERLVGEPVDVIVGDRHFADGEVVVIGEQFGVRITRIHSPQQNGDVAQP